MQEAEFVAFGVGEHVPGLLARLPYITHTVRRFGSWVLNLTPPDDQPNTRLDLEPKVLFAASAC